MNRKFFNNSNNWLSIIIFCGFIILGFIVFMEINTAILETNATNNTSTKINNSVDSNPARSNSGSCGNSGGGCGCGGGGVKVKKDTSNTVAKVENDTQIIKSIYTANAYLQPNMFKVKVGQKVKFTIDVKDDGYGCGYEIMIPNLYDEAIPLIAGEFITMEFTPTTTGSYNITCGMDMITYGAIIVE